MIDTEDVEMNLTLHLNAETEARLKAQAVLTGKSPEVLALEALQEKFAESTAEAPVTAELSGDEWRRQFDAWVADHHSRNPQLNDSRESIYADRD